MRTDPFPLNQWLVESLRFTLFTTPEPIDPTDWWESTVGQPPVETVSKKLGGERTYLGPCGGQTLRLNVSPLRVDWIVTMPEPEGEEPLETVPTIGPFSTTLESFVGLMTRWLASSKPRAKRLALGVVLLHPESDLNATMRTIRSFVPLSLDEGPVWDFLFQVNRRRDSGVVPGLELNRLSKWSRAMFRTMAVQVSAALMAESITTSQVPVGSAECFTRLELDINTAQEFAGVLDGPVLVPLLRELADDAADIARSGVK